MLLVTTVVAGDLVVFKVVCLIVPYFDGPLDHLLVEYLSFEDLLVDVISTKLHDVPLVTVIQVSEI